METKGNENMKLYDTNGWLNWEEIITHATNTDKRLIICVGGRGIGKTYGVLNYLYDHDIFFMFMRTESKEIEFLYNDDMNPFNDLNDDKHIDVHARRLNEYYGAFYEQSNEGEEKQLSIMSALSTIGKTRGFGGARKIKIVVYDEFIPESHVKRMKNQGLAVMNAYETINRNRELQGEPPLLMILLSNANTLDNDVLTELNVLPLHDKLKNQYAENDKIMLIEPNESPISYKKQLTGLYGVSKRFDNMSIKNKFVGAYNGNIRSMNLKNGQLWLVYDELCFWRFTDNTIIYVNSYKPNNAKPLFVFDDSDFERKRFRKEYFALWRMYLTGMIKFETSKHEAIFNRIWE